MSREHIVANLLYELEQLEIARGTDYSGCIAIKGAIKLILPDGYTVFTHDYVCIECGCKIYPIDIENGKYRYCPDCGRRTLLEV